MTITPRIRDADVVLAFVADANDDVGGALFTLGLFDAHVLRGAVRNHHDDIVFLKRLAHVESPKACSSPAPIYGAEWFACIAKLSIDGR